jgi:hypothetical protein
VTVVPVEPVDPVAVVPDRHNSYSDHWNNGKYHRAIDSYISIKRDKHCKNNCH